jgi:hypothetical protein
MADNTLYSLRNFENKTRLTISSFNGGLGFAIWGDQGGARPLFNATITDLGGPEFITHEFSKIGKSSPGTVATINYAIPRGQGSREMDLLMSMKIEHDQKGMFKIIVTDVKNNKPYSFKVAMSGKLSRGGEPLSVHERSAYAFKSLITRLENYFDKNEYGKMNNQAGGGGFKPSGGGFKPSGGGTQNYNQQQTPTASAEDLFS